MKTHRQLSSFKPAKDQYAIQTERLTLLCLVALIFVMCSTLTVTAQVSFPTANTVFVDGKYGVDATGLRERSDHPFQSIAAGYSAASSGDTIIIRPGDYTLSGTITITKNKLRIIGYGARIMYGPSNVFFSLTTPGDDSWLVGLEIDGQRTGTNGNLTGAIYIDAKRNRIVDCYVHSLNQFAVNFGDGAEDTLVEHNRFDDNFGGVRGDTGTNSAVAMKGMHICDNRITNAFSPSAQYSGGVKLHSSCGHYESRILVADNFMWLPGQVGVETQGGNDAMQICRNYVYGAVYGVSLDTVWHCLVSGNRCMASTYIGLEAAADVQYTTYDSNIVDGRNANGTTVMAYGFSSSNSPPGSHNKICNNTILYATSYPVSCNSGQNYYDFIGNTVVSNNYVLVTFAGSHVLFQSNSFRQTQNSPGAGQFMIFDATSRDIDDVNLFDNDFSSSTATFSSGAAIAYYSGASAHNISNVRIIRNKSDGTSWPAWEQVIGPITLTRLKQGNLTIYSDPNDSSHGFGRDDGGGLAPQMSFPHMTDSAAPNDSIYYSTTQSKLVYKNSSGVVNALY